MPHDAGGGGQPRRFLARQDPLAVRGGRKRAALAVLGVLVVVPVVHVFYRAFAPG